MSTTEVVSNDVYQNVGSTRRPWRDQLCMYMSGCRCRRQRLKHSSAGRRHWSTRQTGHHRAAYSLIRLLPDHPAFEQHHDDTAILNLIVCSTNKLICRATVQWQSKSIESTELSQLYMTFRSKVGTRSTPWTAGQMKCLLIRLHNYITLNTTFKVHKKKTSWTTMTQRDRQWSMSWSVFRTGALSVSVETLVKMAQMW